MSTRVFCWSYIKYSIDIDKGGWEVAKCIRLAEEAGKSGKAGNHNSEYLSSVKCSRFVE
jgi:hypothetical protein